MLGSPVKVVTLDAGVGVGEESGPAERLPCPKTLSLAYLCWAPLGGHSSYALQLGPQVPRWGQ